MKRSLQSAAFVSALVLGVGTLQAASFTYHGSLKDSGKPAEGSYDIELTLYSAPTGGSVIGGPLVMYKVPVHGGSFNTEADFGPLSQSFSQAFVSVRVRNAGQGDYAALNMRVQVTAAATSSVCPGAWTLQGNAGNPAGSYLGTADSQPLTFEVNQSKVGQITQSGSGMTATANVVFGSSANSDAYPIGGATIAGGGDSGVYGVNSVVADFATVGGGAGNTANGKLSTVVGGFTNKAAGLQSTVAGGQSNSAGGDNSFAAGAQAIVRDAVTVGNPSGDLGTFVWNDSSGNSFTSSGINQFLIHANGGVGINGTPANHNDELTIYGNGNGGANVDLDLFPYGSTTGFDLVVQTGPTFSIQQTDGVASFTSRLAIAPTGFIGLNGGGATYPLTVGTDTSNGDGAHLTIGGAWTNGSSRTFKDDFAQIDVGDVLAKVIELPLQTWFYQNDHQEGRHLGPMAEDFAHTFGLGDNEKYIATLDEEGVALAAIQGLNQKIEAEKAANAQLKQDNADLRGKLDDVLNRLSKIENQRGE